MKLQVTSHILLEFYRFQMIYFIIQKLLQIYKVGLVSLLYMMKQSRKLTDIHTKSYTIQLVVDSNSDFRIPRLLL